MCINFCTIHDKGLLALKVERVYWISKRFCPQTRLLTHLPHRARAPAHTCLSARAKLTTDSLWSHFSSDTHLHTRVHAFSFAQYVLSAQICILILMSLVYVSSCWVWPTCSIHCVAIKGVLHPAVSPANYYRVFNCYKKMELNEPWLNLRIKHLKKSVWNQILFIPAYRLYFLTWRDASHEP